MKDWLKKKNICIKKGGCYKLGNKNGTYISTDVHKQPMHYNMSYNVLKYIVDVTMSVM